MDRQRFGVITTVALSCLLFIGCGSEGNAGESVTDPVLDPNTSVSGSGPGPGTSSPTAILSESVNGQQWLNSMLFQGQNRLNPRLPNYSYFQGLVQAGEDFNVIGQVRLVGGAVGLSDTDTTTLYQGAMITANPYSFTGAEGLVGGPAGIRTRVGRWEEIPTP